MATSFLNVVATYKFLCSTRQGELTDSTFIVLSGRLRSVITHSNGHKEVVAEYGKGELVGIVSIIMHPRPPGMHIAIDS